MGRVKQRALTLTAKKARMHTKVRCYTHRARS
jgi:hypothetical protein